MLEGPSKDTELIWEARLEGMAPEIDGKIYVTEIAGVNEAEELPPPGTMATVEITGAQDYDLLGRVIEFERNVSTRAPALGRVQSNLISIIAGACSLENREHRNRSTMKRKCPICRKPTDSETDADFPFCSERCRTLDLGNWASEKYVVSDPVFDEDGAEESTPADPDDTRN